MKRSLYRGGLFGLTSGIITTLGMMVGLNSGTHSDIAVLSGILTIAIADGLSDALGIHISEESEDTRTTKQIWGATISTFVTKFVFALTFIIPVLLLPLSEAVLAGIVWGILILTIMSYLLARARRQSRWKTIVEHLLIAIVVIGLTHWLGGWLSQWGR